MKDRPSEFRGCIFDDGWEFDAPCVIYYPWKYRRFGIGGNSGTLDSLVEDICYEIGNQEFGGKPPGDGGLARECEWRRWSLRGFSRRKRAEHVVFKVRWTVDETGWPWAEIVSRVEMTGPHTGLNV